MTVAGGSSRSLPRIVVVGGKRRRGVWLTVKILTGLYTIYD
jgi:hypothetical protein